MWVFLAFLIVALILVASMPPPQIEDARASKIGDFKIPRSNFGDPVGILWGTRMQRGGVVGWFGDFRPVAIKKKISSGLFSSKKVITGYKNYIGMDLILCLGTDVKLKSFWAGSYLVWEGLLEESGELYINNPELFGGEEQRGGLVGKLRFYDGRFDPPQDPYLIAQLGPNVPAYNGLARCVFESFYIGTTTQLEFFSFELSRMTSGLHPTWSIMPNGLDLNPMEICYDAMMLKYGGFGNLPADIDLPSFLDCAETLYNEGLGMSLLVQAGMSGKDLLEEIMRHADGVLYQDPATSKIVAKLIRQDDILEDLLVLDESCILELKNFAKTTWDHTFNQCRVTFNDRANDYNSSVAMAQDFANINFQQRVKSTNINTPGCCDAEVANIIAARQLSLINVPFYKCDLIVNRKAWSLRPGSCFILNWSPFGLSDMIMRVSKIDFGELTDNKIRITCIQDKFSTSFPNFAPPDSTQWQPTEVAAVAVITYRLFTPPYFLSRISSGETIETFNTAGRLYVLANSTNSAGYAFDPVFSLDNFTTDSTNAVDYFPFNGSGLLLGDYLSTQLDEHNIDDSATLTVDGLSVSTIENLKQYSTLAEARDGSALMLINNELLLYVGYEDNLDGSVTFPLVYRGILDTIADNHTDNDRVWFIDGIDGLISSTIPNGQTGYVKLLTVTAGDKLTVAEAPTITAVQSGRAALPLQPQYLLLNGSRSPAPTVAATSINAAWSNRSRLANGLRVYDDVSDALEPNTEVRLRWSVSGGTVTEEILTTNTFDIDVTGLTGNLLVIVDSRLVGTSIYSTYQDSLEIELT